MEDSVFPSATVAALMQEHLVESRLHTDAQNTLTDAQFAKNKELQATIAGTRANPFFVVVDPHSGQKLATFNLSGDFSSWGEKWAAFVRRTARKAGRS